MGDAEKWHCPFINKQSPFAKGLPHYWYLAFIYVQGKQIPSFGSETETQRPCNVEGTEQPLDLDADGFPGY